MRQKNKTNEINGVFIFSLFILKSISISIDSFFCPWNHPIESTSDHFRLNFTTCSDDRTTKLFQCFWDTYVLHPCVSEKSFKILKQIHIRHTFGLLGFHLQAMRVYSFHAGMHEVIKMKIICTYNLLRFDTLFFA